MFKKTKIYYKYYGFLFDSDPLKWKKGVIIKSLLMFTLKTKDAEKARKIVGSKYTGSISLVRASKSDIDRMIRNHPDLPTYDLGVM